MKIRGGRCGLTSIFSRHVTTSGDRSRIYGVTSRPLLRLFQFGSVVLAGLLVFTACGNGPQTPESLPAHDGWLDFQGTWTATGTRHTIRLGADRRASVADYSGSLLLTGSLRPAVGFRAEAVVLNDSVSGLVGRAVWTDERGNQAYSELKGEDTSTGKKITGTFLGGTGRYSKVTGAYEFRWLFLLESDDGTVQGQSVGFKGRVRIDSPPGTSDSGGPQS